MKRVFVSLLITIASINCTGAGGCGGVVPPPTQAVAKQHIQNNVVQARLSPTGFEFIESDVIDLIHAALGKPLEFPIPRTEIRSNPEDPTSSVLFTICDQPGGCTAHINVAEGSLQIERAPPTGDGKSRLSVTASVSLTADNVMYRAGDAGHPERDCRFDINFRNHYEETCRAPGVSWAKPSLPLATRNACNAYCASANPDGERAISAAFSIGVDSSLGYPELSIDDFDLGFSSSADCPMLNDARVIQPRSHLNDATLGCADGSTDCRMFEQSILEQAPMTCVLLQFSYNAATEVLQQSLKQMAIHALETELKKVMTVKCDSDADCHSGTQCDTVVIADAWPPSCTGSGCLLKATEDRVCQHQGKPVPPLAGFTTEFDLGALAAHTEYQPDSAGPISMIAGVGGFIGNDSNTDLSNRGEALRNANRGLTAGGFFGVTTRRSDCVAPKPRPALTTIPILPLPSRAELYDVETHAFVERDYQAAVSVHQDALAQMSWAMYQNGALCFTFHGVDEFQINSKLLALLVSQIDKLENNQSRPAFIRVYPEEIPEITFGRGELAADGSIVSPHLALNLRRVNIEFYSLVSERFVRLFNLRVDASAGVFFEFSEDGKLVPMMSDLQQAVTELEVEGVELLSDRSAIENVIPSMLDLVLPLMTGQLVNGIPLPDTTVVPGYKFEMVGLSGMQRPHGSDYEFLSAFGQLTRVTDATPTRDVQTPLAARVDVSAVEVGRVINAYQRHGFALKEDPRVEFQLSAEGDGGDVEYAYRIDGGLFSPFSAQTTLSLRKPAFRISGTHEIAIMARRRSAPHAFSPVVTTSFVIPEPEVEEDTVEPRELAERRAGCNAGGGLSLFWFGVLALTFRLTRSRD